MPWTAANDINDDSEEGYPDLEQTLDVGDSTLVGEKQNDMILRFNDSVMVGNDHLVTAHDRTYAAARRELDFFNGTSHHARRGLVTMRYCLYRLCRTAALAAQRLHLDQAHVEALSHLENIAHARLLAGLAALTLTLHLAAFDGLLCQAPGLEKTGRPQPLVGLVDDALRGCQLHGLRGRRRGVEGQIQRAAPAVVCNRQIKIAGGSGGDGLGYGLDRKSVV